MNTQLQQDGIHDGFCIAYDEYSAAITETVDDEGTFSGDMIFYIYPGHRHALLGVFVDGVMMKAKGALLNSTFTYHSDRPPSYKLIDNETVYKHDPSSHDYISSDPLLPDHYEQVRVTVQVVQPSTISGAGEGLFAKTDLGKGEVVSFYNGTRLSHKEVDGREWSLNGNTISFNDNCVLDMPNECSTLDNYTASLGHKANHSFNPNCSYDFFYHPRFGEIKCIKTLRTIEHSEELTCCYD